MKKIFLKARLAVSLLSIVISCFAFADDVEFVYAKFQIVHLRVGPGKTYPISWVIKNKGEPLEVSHKIENWLRCKDFDGDEGWVHVSNVSKRDKHVIIKAPGKQYIIAHARSDDSSRRVFRIENGRRIKLKKCEDKWCKISVDNQDAWILKEFTWGAS
jgi:SH3-like domain-containing protein